MMKIGSVEAAYMLNLLIIENGSLPGINQSLPGGILPECILADPGTGISAVIEVLGVVACMGLHLPGELNLWHIPGQHKLQIVGCHWLQGHLATDSHAYIFG